MTQGHNTIDFFKDLEKYQTKGSKEYEYLFPKPVAYSKLIGYVKYYDEEGKKNERNKTKNDR